MLTKNISDTSLLRTALSAQTASRELFSVQLKVQKSDPLVDIFLTSSKLADYPRLSVASYGYLWAIVIDIDQPADIWIPRYREALADPNFPDPSWTFLSKWTYHGHMVWLIEAVATGPNAHYAPQRFLQDIRAQLTHYFGADPDYTGHQTYNPDYKHFQTIYAGQRPPTGHAEGQIILTDPELLNPRSLTALKAGLVSAGAWTSLSHAPGSSSSQEWSRRSIGDVEVGSRNVSLFHMARLDPRDPYLVVHELNQSLADPLSIAEAEGIARSIARYRAVHGQQATGQGRQTPMSDVERQRKTEAGRLGGSRRTDGQKIALAQGPQAASATRSLEAVGRHAQIKHLKAEGYTRREIAERLGVSFTTVKRALKKAQSDPQ